MSDPLRAPDLPREVRACVDAVVSLGRPVYAVGGAVRDRLLGLPVDDFDFATASLPADVEAALAQRGFAVDVDAGLGRVATPAAGGEVVFTSFRREADYGPDRRPRRVAFVTSPAEDAARRDFTVNAVYQDVSGGAVVDPVGGLQDLGTRTLRVIGPARDRFLEDPLRVLRAVRFAASRTLRMSPATFAAVAECGPCIAGLSGRRRFEELEGMLGGSGAAQAVELILDLGVLGNLVPELRGQEARVRRFVLPCLAALEEDRAAARLGGLSILLGHPATAEAALVELGAPRSLRQAVVGVLTARAELGSGRASAGLSRLLRGLDPAGQEVLRIWDEVEPAGGDRVADLLEGLSGVPELPSGAEVLALGVPAGPGVGEVLRAVREAIDREGSCDPSRIRDILVREAAAWIKRSAPGGR